MWISIAVIAFIAIVLAEKYDRYMDRRACRPDKLFLIKEKAWKNGEGWLSDEEAYARLR